MARTPDTGTTRSVVSLRIDPSEQHDLETVQEELGEESLSATVRALPRVWIERQALMRAALDTHVRGRLTRGELNAVLDSMNGTYLAHEAGHGELLGSHVLANVADSVGLERHGCDHKKLVAKLADMPRAGLVGLELWGADLWRAHEDDERWEREVKRLAAKKA